MTEQPAPPTFEEFVASRGPSLWRTAWLLTGDAHKAEDLVQTALLKCWPRWERICSRGPAEAYVRRVLVTTYTDWWRRRWTGEVPTASVPDNMHVMDADTSERHDVLTALASLSRSQRAVLVLRFCEDLSVNETAELLGVTTGTVKSHTSRALAALRTSTAIKEQT